MHRKILLAVFVTIMMSVPFLALGAQKTITTYTWDSIIQAQPVATPSMPPANSQVISASFNAVLDVLNLDAVGSKVGAVTYSDSSGCSSIWAVFRNYPDNVSDPENTSCKIGTLIVPLSTTAISPLRQTWVDYGSVSYDVQVKVGWYQNLVYAAQGINVRWKESTASPGKYEGYGISFLNFNDQASSCSSANVDYIPNSIKPGGSNSLRRTLFIVLWQQKVVGGIERRNWLAYAILGVPGGQMNDPKVIGNQSTEDSNTITDNVTLLVRVEDKIAGTQRFNDIKIYYGDPSTNSTRTSGTRGNDAIATNVYRNVYLPKCSASVFPKWPSNVLEAYSTSNPAWTYWSYPIWYPATPYVLNNYVIPVNRLASDGQPRSYRCTTAGTSGNSQPIWPASSTVADGTVVWTQNGTTRPTTYDYFTLLSASPQTSGSKVVTMVVNSSLVNDVSINNYPTATVALQADRATIRTSDFTLATYPSTKPEIALHGMGYLRGSSTVAFNDLALQILGRRE